MSSTDSLVSYVFLYLITYGCLVLSRQYYIREGHIPSYMYRKFYNVEENIFPNFIQIEVSVSSVSGTLLYSIDKNMNQLIVTLRDNLLSNPPYGIEVELNKQYTVLSLSQLCTCQGCEFDIRGLLSLRIIINTYLIVTCNSGKSEGFKIEGKKGLDQNYPILYSSNNSKTIPINEAHLWLVNHPTIVNILPNAYQMYGCIFNVFYNYKLIAFTNVSSNIGEECKKACTDTICNGGQCHFYYSGVPICNCTKTFLNGQFCNDRIQPLNIKADSLESSFKMLKLSWKSTVNEIFELKNGRIRIALIRKDVNLLFEYIYTDKGNTSREVTLSEQYVADTESIFIVYFHEKVIDIWLYNNKLWLNVLIPFLIDLGNEQFDSIKLRSGKGTMDLVHKNHFDNVWSKLIFLKSKTIKAEFELNKPHLGIGVSVVFLVLIFAISIWCIILWKRKQFLTDKDRKCIDECKKKLKWHIIDKSKPSRQEWIDYIIANTGAGEFKERRLERMYESLREGMSDSEYSHRMYSSLKKKKLDIAYSTTAVLFFYVRIFVLPPVIKQAMNESLLDDVPSFKLLMKLLSHQNKNQPSKYHLYYLIFRLKYLLEPMLDCLEDLTDIYKNNNKIHKHIYTMLRLVAYWRIAAYPYKDYRDTTSLHTYLKGDESVKLWAAVIMCYYGDGWENSDFLRQYLDDQLKANRKVSKDEIIVYAALIRGAANKGDRQLTLTGTDYRMIDAINNKSDILATWSIGDNSDNIIKLFIDTFKDGIIGSYNRNISLTEDQKSSIKCLCESLKNASFNNYNNILSLLDELYPLLTNSSDINNTIAVEMEDMALSIIEYLDNYGIYHSEPIKERIFSICHKYSSNDCVSNKIKVSLSNIKNDTSINKSVNIPDTSAQRLNEDIPLISHQ